MKAKKETSKKRPNSPFTGTEGKRFSKNNQPSSENKKKGWKKKRALKDLLNLCLIGTDKNSITARESLAAMLDMEPEEIKKMTFEEIIDLQQIKRAMSDTKAWQAIKERAYGAPKQKLDINEVTAIKIIRE